MREWHVRSLSWLGVALLVAPWAAGDDAAKGPSGPRFSRPDTQQSPNGALTYHGPFSNETLTLNWDDLPAHKFVRVECDLLILRSWDGSVPYDGEDRSHDGPDYVRVAMDGGATLLFTTFSNIPDDPPGFYDANKHQNYPSPVPGDSLAAQTGATAKSTLGYHFAIPGPPQLVPMDATYHLNLLVPHGNSAAAVTLGGSGLQDILDENWGVNDVKITPLTAEEVPTPDDAAIAAAFTTALDVTSTAQPDAVNTLIAGLDRTADWIGQNVQPQPVDGQALAGAIHDLGGDDEHMMEREAADHTLRDLGIAAEPALRDARRTAHGEVRYRIDRVLDRLGVLPLPNEEARRLALATRVLEVIGTPAALDVRKKLTGMN